MERRDLFKSAAFLLPTVGIVLSSTPVKGQGDSSERVVPNVVDTPSWNSDYMEYSRLRWGAFTYASLVIYFGAPEGNIPKEGDSVFSRLEMLLPYSFDSWISQGAPRTLTFTQNNRKELVEALTELQKQNSDAYAAWLERVGIVTSGQVSNTILSGQALATLASLAEADDSGDILERIGRLGWWFWPFCW